MMDFDAVSAAIRHAHHEAVAPYFRSLSEGQVSEKAPGDIVTIADRECEVLLGSLLADVVDAPVVGEEATAADPSLPDLLASAPAAWVVDPIDGTRNFADGRAEYAVMVAFIEEGTTTASWIFQPQFDRMAVASRGAGATINGESVMIPEPADDPSMWGGPIKDRYLPEDRRARVDAAAEALGPRLAKGHCAGFEYPDLLTGEHAYLLYWRTKPWDHAPGALLVEEAGGLALRPDGSSYHPGDDAFGLVAAHASIAPDLHLRLLA